MAEPTNLEYKITLNDGNKMPIFGLGCWDLGSDEASYNNVTAALNEGYRLIDTAAAYKNEKAVGQALRDSNLKRDDYFLVTKLDSNLHGYEEAKESLNQSLEKLGLDYVDLFLIHSPRPGRIVETWKALVELKKEGKTKSIGVSNFSGEQIAGLVTHGMEKPAIDQMELHPLLQQDSTVTYCRENGIAVMGYCPLARCKFFEVGRVPVLDEIISKLNKSKAQVCLRWAVQNQFVSIPKSSNPARLKENASIFDWSISKDDMKAISGVDEKKEICKASRVMHLSWDFISKADDKGVWC